MRYTYRKHFGLSAKEMNEEPTDEFFTNLYIYAQIVERNRLEAKNG